MHILHERAHLPEWVGRRVVMMGAGLRVKLALFPEAVCRGDISGAPFLRPLTSAGDRSTRSESCFPGSTQVGPPFLYTPVYVDCTFQRRLSHNLTVLLRTPREKADSVGSPFLHIKSLSSTCDGCLRHGLCSASGGHLRHLWICVQAAYLCTGPLTRRHHRSPCFLST